MTDEETLLQFPCDFPIKIMGNNTEHFLAEITNIVHQHYPETTAIQSRPSKNKKYLAITVTVVVQNKPALDALYHALTAHPDCKMVL